MNSFPDLGDDELAGVIAYHTRITEQSFGAVRAKQDDFSDRARDAIRLLNSGTFGCHTRQTAMLCEIILGEPVSKAVKDFTHAGLVTQHLQGTMVTVVRSVSGARGGITYCVGTVHQGGDIRAHAADNTLTNTVSKNNFRKATPEEITAFFYERYRDTPQQPTLPTPNELQGDGADLSWLGDPVDIENQEGIPA